MGEQAKRELMVSNARENRKHIQNVQFKAREKRVKARENRQDWGDHSKGEKQAKAVGASNLGELAYGNQCQGEKKKYPKNEIQCPGRKGKSQGEQATGKESRQEAGRVGNRQGEQARDRESRQQARRAGKRQEE